MKSFFDGVRCLWDGSKKSLEIRQRLKNGEEISWSDYVLYQNTVKDLLVWLMSRVTFGFHFKFKMIRTQKKYQECS